MVRRAMEREHVATQPWPQSGIQAVPLSFESRSKSAIARFAAAALALAPLPSLGTFLGRLSITKPPCRVMPTLHPVLRGMVS